MVAGSGTVKADWALSGEDGDGEKEATPPAPAAAPHPAQQQISFTGWGASPLNFKASLERGLFSYQGDWRYFGSKTLRSHCLTGSLTMSYVSDTGGIYSLEARH